MTEIRTRHLPSKTQKRHHLNQLAASTLSNAQNARDPISSPQRGRVCVPHKKVFIISTINMFYGPLFEYRREP